MCKSTTLISKGNCAESGVNKTTLIYQRFGYTINNPLMSSKGFGDLLGWSLLNSSDSCYLLVDVGKGCSLVSKGFPYEIGESRHASGTASSETQLADSAPLVTYDGSRHNLISQRIGSLEKQHAHTASRSKPPAQSKGKTYTYRHKHPSMHTDRHTRRHTSRHTWEKCVISTLPARQQPALSWSRELATCALGAGRTRYPGSSVSQSVCFGASVCL